MLKNTVLVISGVSLAIVIAILLIQNNYSNQLKDLERSKVTLSKGIEYAMTRVDKLDGVFSITDSSSYKHSKEEMHSIMSEDIFEEYFPSDEYGGWNGYYANRKSLQVEKNDTNSYTFKVVYEFYNDQDSYTNTYLVKVIGSKIVSIASLGL